MAQDGCAARFAFRPIDCTGEHAGRARNASPLRT
jgi:hypothetical protein